MNDLIDRQAAIDAVLDRMDAEKHGRNAKAEEIQWTLERLPSAQPEVWTQMSSSDTISRQEAIDLWVWGDTDMRAHSRVVHVEDIEALPSAQPEQRWIPCSERLPEDLEEVNVTWVNHIPEPYYDFLKDKPFAGSAVYYRGEWFWYSSRCVDILAEYGANGMDKVDDGVEITAWMPLPEPYRMDGDICALD